MPDVPGLKALIVATVAGTMAATAIAVADTDLPTIAPHRHFVQTEKGLVEVGPRVCDNPNVQAAFNQFHSNVHRAVTGSNGPVQAAPGLHNGFGGELRVSGC